MSYEPETKKVDLDEGGVFGPFKKRPYAIFYVELRHGTQRACNTLTRPFLKFPDRPPTLTVEEDQAKIEGDVNIVVDLTAVNWDEINDTLIIGQVKEWSFGPVDQETLDGLTETMRGRLVSECDRLYGSQGPLPKGGGGN